MSQLRKIAGDARTIAFPNTTRGVQYDAFWWQHRLRSVVTNEGLEALGDQEQQFGSGIFANTSI